ncbi:Hypothetical protein CINCED_3A020659 [Cinara cedri]|uniref:Structural maintenance of chromosomes protein 5 n=1 Tax=Cinara cedri TaxID=506608 RepID=A0A5E4NH95_9HEMI|nr:Hypothetical protein CINCED_3A020659 [Cinara cedri]
MSVTMVINTPSTSSNTREAKKRKLDKMIDGSIVKLMLKNFMTFSEVTYTPNSKLNLVIGPNGSGKSSIVTAFMLGFGGSPKDINRGEKVSQFVKIGASVADIFIELYRHSNSNINLRRTIFVGNETCHYYINNVMVSKKKYIDLVESLNIRVHNLCQFLPQDRLEDFSKLDSKGLLLSAFQSIEDQELLNNFNKLKELAINVSVSDADLKKLQHKIEIETATNSKLETIVSSFTEKELLEDRLLAIVQKRCWSLYILTWNQIKIVSLSIIYKQKQLIDTKETENNNWKSIVLEQFNIGCKLLEKINGYVRTANDSVNDIKEIHKSSKQTKERIEDYRESILSMEEKLESIRKETLNVEEYKQELVQINKKIVSIDEKLDPMKRNLEDVRNKLKGVTNKVYAIDQELEREKRKEDGKNQLLQRNFPEIWKAISWLRKCDKKSIFVGQVFEPLFTQIEVLDKKNAKYIESIVNYRDLIAFVFEFGEDLSTFNRIIKEQRWQRINTISAPPPNYKVNEISNYNINELKQFGFHSYAMDLINAPPIIKRYLARNYDLHNIPIGSNEVLNNMQHLPNDIGFFFADNAQIAIKTSIYTGEKITRQTQISTDAQFLLFSVDTNLIQILTMKKEELIVECNHFEQQLTESMNHLQVIEDSRQPFFTRKKEIQGSFMKYQNKKNAFDKMTKDVEFTRSELKREEEKSTKYVVEKKQKTQKYFDSMSEAVELLNNYTACIKLFMASTLIVNHFCDGMHEENMILMQLKSIYEATLNNFNEYLMYLRKLESEFKKMLDVALHWSQGVTPYDTALFEPFKEKFDSIEQNDISDLDELIVEMKAKLNCLNIDPNAPKIIQEYKNRKLNIKNMQKQMEDLNNNAQSKETEIETLQSEWLPKLKALVNLLSKNFSTFLTSFGCDGVIELDTGVTRYDFEAYGLMIKVQFRNDNPSMRQLDVKSQSGGERALTTALFLLALQEVTHFPFRIVDEINQGMDKVYERKLMELFMHLFEDRNNQYFVITPKLIKNLSFRNTTVDIINCRFNCRNK